MQMTPEETELALRDLAASVLRSLYIHSGGALLNSEPKAKMAGIVLGVLTPVDDVVRFMEEGHRRGTIPAPAAAKEKVSAALAKINPVLEQICAELFMDS